MFGSSRRAAVRRGAAGAAAGRRRPVLQPAVQRPRQDREADLIVAWPGVGVAVVEVKGGSVSLQRRGVAAARRRRRQGHPPGRPGASPASTCSASYLAEHPRWSAGRPRTAHLVALPATTLPGDFIAPGPGALDGRSTRPTSRTPPHASRRRCARSRDEPDPPTAEDVEDAGRLPRRDGDPAAAPPGRAGRARGRLRPADPATRPRCSTCSTAYHRVEIRGGAGSGKTWLAVEKARRLAADGQRVALMCYSRGLAEFLKRRVEKLPQAAAARPTSAPSTTSASAGACPPGSDDDSRYWEEFLPGRDGDAGRRRCPRRSGSTPSSSTRRRTSPRAGGTPSSRRCATRTTAASTSSPTRASASSPGRGGRPST